MKKRQPKLLKLLQCVIWKEMVYITNVDGQLKKLAASHFRYFFHAESNGFCKYIADFWRSALVIMRESPWGCWKYTMGDLCGSGDS